MASRRVGPAGHRAGVPVLEQPPGVEHERVLLARAVPWRAAIRRAPGGPSPSSVLNFSPNMHHGAVAVLGVRVRVQLAGQAEVVVGQVGVAGHDRDHLLEDVPRRWCSSSRARSGWRCPGRPPSRPGPRRAGRAPCGRAAPGGRCWCRCRPSPGRTRPGRMTSANSAVSVRKMSCTTRKSSADSALRTLLMLGSDRNGFSPSMYMPRTPPLSAEPMISVTVSPLLGIQVGGAPRPLEPGPDGRVVRPSGSPGRTSGSGPCPRRPARCSARAADAVRCPACRRSR